MEYTEDLRKGRKKKDERNEKPIKKKAKKANVRRIDTNVESREWSLRRCTC
jgi:hypothetical protein